MLNKVVGYVAQHTKTLFPLALLLAAVVMLAAIPREALAQSGETTLTGTTVKVDSAGMKLTVKDSANKEEILTLDSSTKITRDGKAAKLADLKEGDRVKVTRQGTKVSSVEVTSKSS